MCVCVCTQGYSSHWKAVGPPSIGCSSFVIHEKTLRLEHEHTITNIIRPCSLCFLCVLLLGHMCVNIPALMWWHVYLCFLFKHHVAWCMWMCRNQRKEYSNVVLGTREKIEMVSKAKLCTKTFKKDKKKEMGSKVCIRRMLWCVEAEPFCWVAMRGRIEKAAFRGTKGVSERR